MRVKLYRKQLEDLLLSSGLKEDDIPSLWNGLKELASREKNSSKKTSSASVKQHLIGLSLNIKMIATQISNTAGSSKERTKLRHRQSKMKQEVTQILKNKQIGISLEDLENGIFPAENNGGMLVFKSILYRH